VGFVELETTFIPITLDYRRQADGCMPNRLIGERPYVHDEARPTGRHRVSVHGYRWRFAVLGSVDSGQAL
jgi:hypothetical protein